MELEHIKFIILFFSHTFNQHFILKMQAAAIQNTASTNVTNDPENVCNI
jgi:hypothetical protein